MTAQDFFDATYALMAREAGSRGRIEEVLEEWAVELEHATAVTGSAAPVSLEQDVRDLMELQPPAERRKR